MLGLLPRRRRSGEYRVAAHHSKQLRNCEAHAGPNSQKLRMKKHSREGVNVNGGSNSVQRVVIATKDEQVVGVRFLPSRHIEPETTFKMQVDSISLHSGCLPRGRGPEPSLSLRSRTRNSEEVNNAIYHRRLFQGNGQGDPSP